MILFVIFYFLSTLTGIHSATVTSPQIRILDVATKASETRLIPNRIEYRNPFHHYFHPQNSYGQTAGPVKSYVIYDDYPQKIIKEWKANPPAEFPVSNLQNFLELSRQPNADTAPAYYFQNGQQILPPTKPTLAYSSVYSNVIKVFDNSLDNLDRNHFQSEKYVRPLEGSSAWKNQPPNEYESIYLQDIPRRQMYHNLKLPENFPKVFSPNEKFHFPSFEEAVPQPPKFFYPQEGYYDTYTVNYNKENTRHRDEVEVLSEVNLKPKNQKKTFLCSFIKVNQRYFPQEEGPCGRTDELPIVSPQYPDYSNLPNDKIPVEHRRHHFQIKRIKRSEFNESYETRQKRDAGFGYGYSGWGSPFGYENGYDGYFGDNYPSRGGYRGNYNSGYYSNRNRNQNYRGKYNSGSRYDDYDDDYQSNDDSNSRGLTGYLTNGGRRYKNRKNNNDEDDDDDDDDNNENNRNDDSDEEMERMNSNRRDTNDRRNNDDSRDRRRNNNYNDDDDYRDNRRNNNRNNNNNSRRNNNNNNNNNNSNSRRYNDRNDYNNNRNRYYGNSNGYNNNGYGSSYGGYGSNYGGGYGSSYGNNGGYGSSYGNNGGYGSSYGNNGGYGYGGYGNGFGSF